MIIEEIQAKIITLLTNNLEVKNVIELNKCNYINAMTEYLNCYNGITLVLQ